MIRSYGLHGVTAHEVTIERAPLDPGLGPSPQISGLPPHTAKEARVRLRCAFETIGVAIPEAHLRVTGQACPAAGLDLAMAAELLSATLQAPLGGVIVAGELALDGTVRPVRGAMLAAAMAVRSGVGTGEGARHAMIVPHDSRGEALAIRGPVVYAVRHLRDLLGALDAGSLDALEVQEPMWRRPEAPPAPDMSEVRGQKAARWALEVAAAGGHSLMLVGPPGIGKTMLARRIPSILPPMTRQESIDASAAYSAVGLLRDGLLTERPFRAPHHTVSAAALLGGGATILPGEVSLAHRGVLFLDEVDEFRRGALEALAQTGAAGEALIGRLDAHAIMPARFQLIASTTACPCGWHGSPERACACSEVAIQRFRLRLPAGLTQLRVRVDNVSLTALRSPVGESSAAIRERVVAARDRQVARLAGTGAGCNAEMSSSLAARLCSVAGGIDHLIRPFLPVAQTIADLAGAAHITPAHIARAMELMPERTAL